ncbi:unnamed protein product [Paramecium pentaurelia]|uniref:Serine aminopeptidase S33 domain-containing protein n=1 Tax=Paramecium pentaurelia TaxID=43138 RepID=A0A8S1UH78_9CILI|nr:unnamed protein product [Paramecium pentaurelia]
MSDQESSHIALIVVFSIFIGIYLFVLFIIHCFGKINNIIFPAPTPKYQESDFQDNLQYASIYNKDGNLVNGKPNDYSQNLEKIRSIPYVYLKNKYWETNLYIIYFHGNAEDMYAAVLFMEQLMKTINANMFVIEYPGYGIYRNVQPTSILIEQDSLALYDEIKNEFKLNDDQIYIFGRSIGTGPSFYLASQRNIKGLISMSAYKSIRYIIDDFCFGCGCILNILCCLPHFFRNLERSQQIKCPIVLIHGEDDALIQSHHSQEIFENLPLNIQQQSYLIVRPRMTHNEYDIEDDIAFPISESFTDLKPKRF